MSQRLDEVGDVGSRSSHSSSSTLMSDQSAEHPNNRLQTGSSDGSPTFESIMTDELLTSDIIIAVMGPTGAGKSTFINMASGTQQATVGHGIMSCTKEVQQISYVDEGRRARIVLVDTPGFDDTNLSDLEILRRISEWLKETHGRGILLSGILIFHRISDPRMGGTPLGAMKMFQDLCGKDALSNVMLVTTMWDEVELDQGQQREKELQENYWQPMLAHGARMLRFHHTEASAHAIISRFQRSGRRSLLIQDQMKKGKAWYETSAATTLFGPLAKLIKKILGLIHWLDHLIRNEKNPTKRLQLSRKKEHRQSFLSDLIDASRPSSSFGSSLQRRSSAPSTYPLRHIPPVSTAFPDTVLGNCLQGSPASIRGSNFRSSVTSYPSPAQTHDSLTDQSEELRRLYHQIPVSGLRDSVRQMLLILEKIHELYPSDDFISPFVERIGLPTIAVAQDQPSVDDVKHTVDEFQTVLTQMLDQLQSMLSRDRRAEQQATHGPGTIHQCPTNTNELTDDPQPPRTSGGADSPGPIERASLETLERMETLLLDLQCVGLPHIVNIYGGSFFDIQGDYLAFHRPSSPDPKRESVPNSQLQPERRHSMP